MQNLGGIMLSSVAPSEFHHKAGIETESVKFRIENVEMLQKPFRGRIAEVACHPVGAWGRLGLRHGGGQWESGKGGGVPCPVPSPRVSHLCQNSKPRLAAEMITSPVSTKPCSCVAHRPLCVVGIVLDPFCRRWC